MYWERSEEYLQMQTLRLLSPDTLRLYGYALRSVLKHADEMGWPSDPKKIMPIHILELNNWLQRYDTGTQNSYLRTTIRFLKWCKNTELNDIHIKITVARTRVNWLTSQQVGQIIHAAREPYEKAILTTMAYTGGRCSEVGMLRNKDVTEKELRFHGKGRKDRNIPLDAAYWREMTPYVEYRQRLRPVSDFFIVHQWGQAVRNLSGHAIGTMCDRVSRRLDFEFSPHDLRRTFGRDLYRGGCDIVQLSEIMGHSSIEQTKRYLGIGEYDISAGMKFRPDYGGLIS